MGTFHFITATPEWATIPVVLSPPHTGVRYQLQLHTGIRENLCQAKLYKTALSGFPGLNMTLLNSVKIESATTDPSSKQEIW